MRRQVLSFVLILFVLAVSASAAMAQAPPAPTGLAAIPSTAQVTLNWNSVTGATSYNLYRSLTAGGEGHTPYVTGISTNSYTDTGLTNGQTYFYKVTAVNGSGESGPSNETYTTPNFFINSGGSQVTDPTGHVYEADAQYSGGSTRNTGNTITGASTQALYQNQRVGTSFTYTLPMNNGIYGLHLDFAEIEYSGSGQGVFDVIANGVTVLTNEDVYAAAGGEYIAVNYVVPVTVTNGTLTVQFTASHGNASLAALTVQTPAGSAALDIPAPGWAAGAVPSDGGGSDGAGPSSSMSVSLPSGVAENTPGPDIWAYNSVGPSVSYERMYRSSLAASDTYAPGLSPGWVDNYDLMVSANAPDTWGKLTLTYPNGATETWKPVLSGGSPTGAFTVTMPSGSASGAPYLATGVPSTTTGQWTSLTMEDKDHSTYTFESSSGNANFYLLTTIANLVGHSITINYNSTNQITSIVNDAGTTLLSFGYTGTELSTITDETGTAPYRSVSYAFDGNNNLNTVSEISSPSNALWTYTYHSINDSAPIYLASVATPDPADPASNSTAKYQYFGTGALQLTTDANSDQRNYNYGNGYTVVSVVDPSTDNAIQYWSQNWAKSHYNLDRGITDPEENTSALGYGDTSNPYQPTTYTDANNQEDKFTYDQFGNILTAEDYRGVEDKYDMSYENFPLGQVTEIEHYNVKDEPLIYLAPTDIEYYNSSNDSGNHSIDGLVMETITPAANTIDGTTESTPTIDTNYNYGTDTLGNVQSVTTVGPNGTTTINYYYTSGYDGYSQSEALGEPVEVTISGPSYPSGSASQTVYYEYTDGRGNCTAVIDGDDNRTDYYYNDADQVYEVEYPHDTSVTGSGRAYLYYNYEYPGGPVSDVTLYDQTGAVFRETGYTYGPEGELLSVADYDTVTSAWVPRASYLYDADYRMMTSADGLGQTTHYYYYLPGNDTILPGNSGYQPAGALQEVVYPGNTGGQPDTLTYGYDPDRNLTYRLDGNGVGTTYARVDPESLVTGISYSDSYHSISYGYDFFGRRTSMSDGTGSTGYSYDDLDNLLTLTRSFPTGGPSSQELAYDYYDDGLLETLEVEASSGNSTFNYYYDGVNRVNKISFPWSDSETYSYNQEDQVYTQDNGLIDTTYSYSPRGFLQSLSSNNTIITPYGDEISEYNEGSLGFDAAGNRLKASLASQEMSAHIFDPTKTQTYEYDYRDELTNDYSEGTVDSEVNSWSYPYHEAYNWSFDYDAAFNPSEFRYNGTTGGGSFNYDNQLDTFGLYNVSSNDYTDYGSGDYIFDGNGNPTTYETGSFTFDPENRLTGISSPSFSAAYDGDGLRAYSTAGGSTTYYLYDGGFPVAEENASGDVTALNGMGPAGWTERDNVSGGYYDAYAYDPSGNLFARVESGETSYPAHDLSFYDGFGQLRGDVTVSDGDAQSPSDPVGFGGRWGYYTDTATKLVLMTNRYYDPGVGRFVTRDPTGYAGGENLYGFAGNNPINDIDPEGTTYKWWLTRAGWGRVIHHAIFGSFDPNVPTLGQRNPTIDAVRDVPGVNDTEEAREAQPSTSRELKQGERQMAATVLSTVANAPVPEVDTAEVVTVEARLVIGKVDELKSLQPGEYNLLPKMTKNLGSAKLNWARNSSLLRAEMQLGRPIRDAHVGPDGQLLKDNYNSFLNAERQQLAGNGWTYDPITTFWMPPSR